MWDQSLSCSQGKSWEWFQNEVSNNNHAVRLYSNWPTYTKMCFVKHSCGEELLSCSPWRPQANTCYQTLQAKAISSPLHGAELENSAEDLPGVCKCLKSLLRHAHWPYLRATCILLLGRKKSGWVNLRHGSYSEALSETHPSKYTFQPTTKAELAMNTT